MVAQDVLATRTNPVPRVEWLRCLPFLLLHVACLGVLWVGWSWTAVGIALATLFLRVFGLTAFYHRYFSHRSFKTSRWFQFCGAIVAAAAGQRGPLWWAAHHRAHHRSADTIRDPHSPVHFGFFWSHMAWFMTREHVGTDERLVRDWLRYPEIRFLDRNDFLVPLAFAMALFGLGAGLEMWMPWLGTSGWQVLVWGFVVSTVALYHLTFAVNSVAHRFGTRPYATKDDSRNSFLLALLTFGEGWHNNHHHYPASARQGFRWWQIDITYYLLVVLSWAGLVWDLKPVPRHIQESYKRKDPAPAAAGSVGLEHP
ncbi:MAG: acyl-CoA desaturase [Planctomycetes bacterium]|nr:acyl-CoA desaturase [Planctomycetota bacterium]